MRYSKEAQHAVAHTPVFPHRQSILSTVLAGNKITSGQNERNSFISVGIKTYTKSWFHRISIL